MSWKKLRTQMGRELRKRRDGILIGALAGLIVAQVYLARGADVSVLADSSRGLIDSVFARESAMQVARYKFHVGFVFFGALIGYVADMVLEALRLPKKKKVASRTTKRKMRRRKKR